MINSSIERILTLLEYSVGSVVGGIFWLVIGLLCALWVYKTRNNPNHKGYTNSMGWFSAIGMVVLGVLVIVRNLIKSM